MCQLDLAGPGLVGLAMIAEWGERLERALLTPERRAACEQTVAGWRAEAEHYVAVRDRAVRASRTVATTSADQPGYRSAAREFHAAWAELTAIRPQYRHTRDAAAEAAGRLARDRRERDRHHQELTDGARARAELAELLDARMTEALDWGWPLPDWFTSVLGTGPPQGGAAPWRAMAVQLLAYRITYGVQDPARALGDPPDPETSGRRGEWFDDLHRRLAGFQASPTP